MPIYKVTEKEAGGLGAALGNGSVRLVKADSAAQAIRHCTKDRFSAETVTKVEEAADLIASGVKVETAGDVPAEPEAEKVEPEGGEADEGKAKGGRSSSQPAGGKEPEGD